MSDLTPPRGSGPSGPSRQKRGPTIPWPLFSDVQSCIDQDSFLPLRCRSLFSFAACQSFQSFIMFPTPSMPFSNRVLTVGVLAFVFLFIIFHMGSSNPSAIAITQSVKPVFSISPTPSPSPSPSPSSQQFNKQPDQAQDPKKRPGDPEDLDSEAKPETPEAQKDLPEDELPFKQKETPNEIPVDQKSGLKLAYATFLNAPDTEPEDDNDDNYFVSTRMLIYQLLHDPSTRSNNSIPVVVVVTSAVTQRKRDRFIKDGARVIEVSSLKSSWIKPKARRWKDQLTKLRMYEALTDYDRVLYLDSDTVVTRPMDTIFSDPAAEESPFQDIKSETKDDEAPPPTTYVFAGNSGSGGQDHPYPPPKGKYLNGGFILFKPSKALFDHYISIANIKGRFDATYAEQSLLNYAHRRDGNLPWKQLHFDWNINWANYNDYKQGVASLHVKFWDDSNDRELRDYLMRCRGRMEGYWAGVEGKEG